MVLRHLLFLFVLVSLPACSTSTYVTQTGFRPTFKNDPAPYAINHRAYRLNPDGTKSLVVGGGGSQSEASPLLWGLFKKKTFELSTAPTAGREASHVTTEFRIKNCLGCTVTKQSQEVAVPVGPLLPKRNPYPDPPKRGLEIEAR